MFSSVYSLIKDLVKPGDSWGFIVTNFFIFLVLKHGGLFPYITSEDGKTWNKTSSKSAISLDL